MNSELTSGRKIRLAYTATNFTVAPHPLDVRCTLALSLPFITAFVFIVAFGYFTFRIRLRSIAHRYKSFSICFPFFKLKIIFFSNFCGSNTAFYSVCFCKVRFNYTISRREKQEIYSNSYHVFGSVPFYFYYTDRSFPDSSLPSNTHFSDTPRDYSRTGMKHDDLNTLKKSFILYR